jgi:DNA-binding XRE family transcriptional regulator
MGQRNPFSIDNFKTEIHVMRLRLGWTQHDLARRLDISSEIVMLWEKGLEVPQNGHLRSLDLLIKHADLFSDEIHAIPFLEEEMERDSLEQIELDSNGEFLDDFNF